MKNLLIHKNTKNRYIFIDSIDIEVLKELALSNNELILVNTEEILSLFTKNYPIK